MKEGWWINYEMDEVFSVPEHEQWVRTWGNAQRLGIPDWMIERFPDYRPVADRQDFLLFLIQNAPVMRVRGHGQAITFEFGTDRREAALWNIWQFCQREAGPFTTINVHDFHAGESFSVLFSELEKRMLAGTGALVWESVVRWGAEERARYGIRGDEEQAVEALAAQIQERTDDQALETMMMLAHLDVRLGESSLSRLWMQMADRTASFAIISASRREYPESYNQERYEELKRQVRGLGLGYVELLGGWTEDGQTVEEQSLLLPEVERAQAVEIGAAWGQHSIIYKDGEEFALVSTNEQDGLGVTLQEFVMPPDRRGLEMARERLKQYWSQLVKGSHKLKRWAFTVAERTLPGFNESAYLGRQPEWRVVLRMDGEAEDERD